MLETRQRRAGAHLGLAVAIAALALITAAPSAFAADNGDWQGGYSTWPVQDCLDRSAGVVYESEWTGPSHCLNSLYRDSNFSNERYANLDAHPLNDHVKDFRDNFITIWIQAFHNADYVTASTCIPHHTVIGPYPIGVHNGLSSFRGC